MAMQAGMGLSRIVLLAGAGYTAIELIKDGKLPDVLRDILKLVKQKSDVQGDSDNTDAASQVQLLAMEVRRLASSRQITVLNDSNQSISGSLIVPTAALGALGYGYMWWKGIKFSDLMYVSRQSMANAVTNLTKHLDHVSEALAAAKRHLTQRIQNLDDKLDDQVDASKLLRNEVNGVRDEISQIGINLDELRILVSGLDGKLLSLEDKQELANAGVMYLCSVVNGRKVRMPEMLQDQLKINGNSAPSLMGLKEITDSLSPESLRMADENQKASSDNL